MNLRLTLAAILPLLLTGCSLTPTATPTPQPALGIQGTVHGGQQPVNGAHVYLFAAATSGYGAPSTSLLTAAPSTFPDTSTGPTAGDYYVTTNARGYFNITGDYACTPGTQVYIVALGGNPGSGINPASGLMSVLGNCPAAGNFLAATPFLSINEVTTIAAAYAIAGFATDVTHVASSGTPLAQTGIANAFANAANLASLSGGQAYATTPNGNGIVPLAEINTLANILAACVNSTGLTSSACGTLLSSATADGTSTGTQPTETATAAINIAHFPGANVAALYSIPTPATVFAPALTAQPNNFIITLEFGLANTVAAGQLAIDASGNVWIAQANTKTTQMIADELSPAGALLSGANGFGTDPSRTQFTSLSLDPSGNLWSVGYNSYLTELSQSGTLLSGTNGFTGGGLSDGYAVALDGSGNAWVANGNANNVIEFSPSGSPISGTTGYTGGGLTDPGAIAIDGLGNAWVIPYMGSSVTRLSNTGAALSPATGYTGGGITGTLTIAIDSANSAWIVDETNVVKLSSSGAILSGSGGFTTAGNGSIAIDGAGNVFVPNIQKSTLTELNNSGTVVPGAAAYSGASIGTMYAVAVDGSGNLWCNADGTTPLIHELIGIATPVVTPISAGVKNNTLATRP